MRPDRVVFLTSLSPGTRAAAGFVFLLIACAAISRMCRMGDFTHQSRSLRTRKPAIGAPVRWVIHPSRAAFPKLPDRPHAAPLRLHPPLPDIAVDRRIRPLRRPLDIPMPDRIGPTIPDVVFEIRLVPQATLPEPALPHTALVLGALRRRAPPHQPGGARDRALISRQRVEKSASPAGSVQIAWRCSGNTTMASQRNGRSAMVSRNAARKVSMWSTSVRACRSASATVKK
jgi:hypothetical protein